MSRCLSFTYSSYVERGSDNKSKFFSGDGRIEYHWVKKNRLARSQALALSELKLQAEMKKGNKGDQDISFDFKFILGMMDKLGNSTQSSYCSIRVVSEEIIYLVMDNAVVHGEN